MKQSVNFDQFTTAFNELRPDNFSQQGLSILFDYMEDLQQDIGKELELDVIAICCEYSEESLDDIVSNYGIDLSDCEDDEGKRETVLHTLRENTSFAQLVDNDTIIYHQF